MITRNREDSIGWAHIVGMDTRIIVKEFNNLHNYETLGAE